jgi:hypothetical protein
VDPSDPRAADIPQMANSAKETLGDRLDTFLLGNVSFCSQCCVALHADDRTAGTGSVHHAQEAS